MYNNGNISHFNIAFRKKDVDFFVLKYYNKRIKQTHYCLCPLIHLKKMNEKTAHTSIACKNWWYLLQCFGQAALAGHMSADL